MACASEVVYFDEEVCDKKGLEIDNNAGTATGDQIRYYYHKKEKGRYAEGFEGDESWLF